MPLPHDFLIDMARKYGLVEEQEKTLLEWFGSNKSRQEIEANFNISESALRSRKTEIYKKFSISGQGPVKERRLLNFLNEEYQKLNSSASSISSTTEEDINALVQDVREKGRPSIQQHCGEMKVLDMSQPIGLSDIYTSVNILDRITGRRGLGIADLMQDCKLENFERFGLGKVAEKRVAGLKAVEKYSKLIVLGKPGAGKTTFLKHLAIQCNGGEFQAHRIPIFITLKDFAEAKEQPDLLAYIMQNFSNCGVTAEQVAQLLSHGRGMVLLDGLDEVREVDNSRVLKQVRDFSNQFETNHFVMTCRIAAQEYTFEKFTEVEIADFDKQQITAFAIKWFQAQGSINAERFIKKLQDNKPIQELATNPLLLTLLCLEFEESLDFPTNRSELYNRALKVLLSKWDAKRGVKRDQVYKKLSLQRKEDLLSQIALISFERGDYFFKQKSLEQLIADYIYNLPNTKNDSEALQLNSEAVLKSIEAQHGLLVERARGIYSFSHLTFQEYFTARKSVASFDLQALKQLVSHITENRWREVFLLATGMLQNADELLQLMKQKTDALISHDNQLQEFLTWVSQKSCVVTTLYKPASVRVLYFGFDFILDIKHTYVFPYLEDNVFPYLEDIVDFAYTIDCNLAYAFEPSLSIVNRDFALDYSLIFALNLALELAYGYHVDEYGYCCSEENSAYHLTCNLDSQLYFTLPLSVAHYCELLRLLQQLKDQLPANTTEDSEIFEIFEEWWQTNGQAWAEKLRSVMIEHRNIGHCWQFSAQQRESLKQYYDANKLLVECLNSDCYVTRTVRSQIEETLLLPIAEIENQQHNR